MVSESIAGLNNSAQSSIELTQCYSPPNNLFVAEHALFMPIYRDYGAPDMHINDSITDYSLKLVALYQNVVLGVRLTS